MAILYNKQGIAVDVPDNAVDDALKNGFTTTRASLSILIKNYDPDVAQADVPVDIRGSLKQVEFILTNQSNSAINVGYGNLGGETLIPGGIPANSKLRLTAYAGTTQALNLPTAILTSSDSDNYVELGSLVTFTATQSGTGTIDKVEFYSGSKLIGTSTTAPYTQSYSFNATGTYRIYAKVYSGTDYTTTNSIQTFAIPSKRQDKNLLPIVSLAAPTTGIINQAITLNATATDPDGSINKVEFYVNSSKIGEDLTSPYTFNFIPTQNNLYQLQARAVDNLGAYADSNIILFVVATPIPTVSVSAPSTSNTNQAVTLSATASITNDTISGVQFKVNGNNQGSLLTNLPYTTSFTPTSSGTYIITAVATGSQGGTATSSNFVITVTTPSVPTPTVAIASSVLSAGVINTALTLAATVSITGDTISGTQFKANTTNVGTSQPGNNPSVNWTPTVKGSYSITATSTGLQGGSATSTAKNIQIFDTKALGGGAGVAGASLAAANGDYMLFDNNQAAGGNAASMNIFVGGNQVGVFNYGDVAYNGKPFAYYYAVTNTLYTNGTIGTNANF